MNFVSCGKDDDTNTTPTSSQKQITSFVFNTSNNEVLSENVIASIDQSNQTITAVVPYGTNISSLTPTIQISNKASVNPTTAQNFTNIVAYTITAEDNSTVVYDVTVEIAENNEKRITSLTFTASDNSVLSEDIVATIDETNKTVTATVPFGTDVTTLIPILSLSEEATVASESGTEQDFTSIVEYTVTAQDETTQVYEVSVNVSSNTEKQITSFIFTASDNSTLGVNIEAIIDETNKTIIATVPFGTNVTALTPSISFSGDAVSPENNAEQDFTSIVEYIVTAGDSSTAAYDVSVVLAEGSTEKQITSFIFTTGNNTGIGTDITAVINESAKTITTSVPFGTDVTTLVPTIILSTGATVSLESDVANDFSSPTNYTVTAEDNSAVVYEVTITIGEGSSEKQITEFVFNASDNGALSNDITTTIDEGAKTIIATVPFGTDVTALIPTITLSTGAIVSPESDVAQDFTSSVTYTVTAEDSSLAAYEVTITIANDPAAKQITSFIFTASNNTDIATDVVAVIDEATKTITATVPYNVNIFTLTPTIMHSGNSIDPGNEIENSFHSTSGVTYTVTAEDNSEEDYTVIVEIENIERQVLTAIYNANPTSNLDDFGWDEMIADPNIDLEEWADNNANSGVLFQAISGHRARITSLRLEDMALTTIPAEIEDLLFLDALHLRNQPSTSASQKNNIISLPSEIENLELLSVLNVSNNENFTTLPTSIGNLPGLTFLYMDNTALTTIPSQVGNIESLLYIQLSGNDDLTSLPSEIGNISGLRGLYLNNNPSLNSIPSEICDLSGGGTIIELTNTSATCN